MDKDVQTQPPTSPRGRSGRRRTLRFIAVVLALGATLGLPAAPGAAEPASVLNPPFAGGDGSANIALNRPGTRILTRWVARHTGVLTKLHLHVKVEGSVGCPYGGRPGYAGGTTGVLEAATYRVLADGRPDLQRRVAQEQFQPCGRERGETIALDLNLSVTRGQEFATIVRNADLDPAANYFSLNFLYLRSGLLGANARNERSSSASDLYYRLDPRELVGYSVDGGSVWRLPGGPYGPNEGRAFLATFIQEYSDGRTAGQPYYSSKAVSGSVTMVYPRIADSWRITHLGAYTSGPGSATVTLSVDGLTRATAVLSGAGVLRAAISPVTAPKGSTVRVTTVAGDGGLQLRAPYGDYVWTRLMGFGTGYAYYLEGDPTWAVPVYPLPSGPTVPAATGARRHASPPRSR